MGEGESIECYVNRAGNATGYLHDKTASVPDKIENNDITLVDGVEVKNLQFRLTPSSTPPTAPDVLTWSAVSAPGLPTGVTFSTSGILTGKFPKETWGTKYTLTVTAKYGTKNIDSRAFVFSPAKATGSNEIAFVHPLPGSVVTSPFGHRRAPRAGASTQHGGVDFAYAGKKPPGDVLAAANGKVILKKFQRDGAGNYVVIQHYNASMQPLCTTWYMHLAGDYVQENQIVVQGQKIGKEGNTGHGTGVHLHFECRLPNGTKIDPLPLIRGSLSVSREATEANEPIPSQFVPNNGGGALTPENVAAKETGCPPAGPTYPKPKGLTTDPIPTPPSGTDWFEKAWFFTMFAEVGPHWTSASPTDAEVIAGAIGTKEQRRKVGYKDTPNYRGGVTKFGIAQDHNKDLAPVSALDYAKAKNRGYNGYWKGTPKSYADKNMPKTAVMMFDLSFLHGGGAARKMARDVGVDTMTAADDDKAVALLSARQRKFMESIPGNQEYSGWFARNANLLQYVKTLS